MKYRYLKDNEVEFFSAPCIELFPNRNSSEIPDIYPQQGTLSNKNYFICRVLWGTRLSDPFVIKNM